MSQIPSASAIELDILEELCKFRNQISGFSKDCYARLTDVIQLRFSEQLCRDESFNQRLFHCIKGMHDEGLIRTTLIKKLEDSSAIPIQSYFEHFALNITQNGMEYLQSNRPKSQKEVESNTASDTENIVNSEHPHCPPTSQKDTNEEINFGENSTKDSLILTKKKSVSKFFVSEFLVYLSQIFVFFLVTILVTHSLTDEKVLNQYLISKMNDDALPHVGYTIMATLTTLGLIMFVERSTSSQPWLHELAGEVATSIGRTIYFFGSTVTGSLLATAIFMHNNPQVNAPDAKFWLQATLLFGVGAFLYGFLASYLAKKKTHIL